MCGCGKDFDVCCEKYIKEKYEYTIEHLLQADEKELHYLFKKHKKLCENMIHDFNLMHSKPCPICQRYETPRNRVEYNICLRCYKNIGGNGEVQACELHSFYIGECEACKEQVWSSELDGAAWEAIKLNKIVSIWGRVVTIPIRGFIDGHYISLNCSHCGRAFPSKEVRKHCGDCWELVDGVLTPFAIE